MPRDISVALKATLASETMALSFCVRVDRVTDGVTLGFTSQSKAFTFEDVAYEPMAAVDPSNIRGSEGTGIDNLDMLGLLDSDTITDVDIRAGLYDDARVTVFFVNAEDLTEGALKPIRGYLGEFTFSDGKFKVEVRSLMQRLQQNVVETTCPNCRVKRLFDSQCNGDSNIDPAAFIFTRNVSVVTDSLNLIFAADSNVTDFYTYGEVQMRSGPNNSLRQQIKTHTLVGGTAHISLVEPFPFAISVGDVGVLTAGCDRSFAQCVAKFANAKNFRGEPHIPGNLQLIRVGRK